MKKTISDKKLLSDDEVKFLKLLAKGICIRQIGERFGLSEHKVYEMFKNIKTKLNAQNKPNAVYIAIQLGIL